jgi:hypothetical protein
MEDESAGESILPQPGLLEELWLQTSLEERQRFVARYPAELHVLLATWDAETHQHTRPGMA